MIDETADVTNHALMKRINRAKVLNAIRQHSPLSRTDIAGLTELDKKSITNFVLELSTEDLVEEVGKRKIEQGRPFTLLSFHRDRPLVMGISLEPDCVSAVLLNLYGELIAVEQASFPADCEFKQIQAAIERVYTAVKTQGGSVAGVGIAVPGIADGAGAVWESVNLPGLKDVNLRKRLAAIIGERIFIEEASLSKALAEKWFGLGRSVPGFVCIDLGIGIGAGIVYEGRLYRGAAGFAGEIGHILVEAGGRRCRCGNRGCLEAYLSERALLQEINAACHQKYTSIGDVTELTPGVREIIAAAGQRLGVGLSYLVNLMCPALIILNGELTRFQEALLPATRRAMQSQSLPAYASRVKLEVSALRHACALGAASLALSEMFEVQGHYYV